jgi:hypothetical protein
LALADLLWACPHCGTLGAIDDDGRCRCQVRFRRTDGARIEASYPDGRTEVRTAAAWVDELPDPATLLEAREGEPVRRADVVFQEVTGTQDVHSGGQFLNRIERFGPARNGFVELRRNAFRYGESDADPVVLPMEELTAVQASSNTLQLKARHRPLVSFRFTEDSVFLWEILAQTALSDFYQRSGRGRIVEFQPRIAAR